MSQKCEKLHEILGEGKKFDVHSLDDANLRKELNHTGLYIFYEKNETGHGGDRIVRVGITEASLYERNDTHFNGTKRCSAFRRHLGRAIIIRDYTDNTAKLENWNKKDGKSGYIPDRETEEKVSRYLAKNCYFKAVAIDDIEKVKELEKRMIATVAQCDACKPSKGWLGKNSPNPKIRDSGLWQEEGLTGEELSDNDLAEIEKHLIIANRKNELFNDDDSFCDDCGIAFYDECLPPDVPIVFTFMSALHEKFKDIRYDWRPDFLEQFRFPAFDSLHWDEPIDHKAILAALPNDYKSIWIALYHNAKARQEKSECIFSQVAPFLDVYKYYDSVRYWDGIRKIKDSLRFVCYIDDIKTIFEDPGYEVLVPDRVYGGRAYYPAYCPEDIKEKWPWIRKDKEMDYLGCDPIFAPYFQYARKLTLKNYPKDVKEKCPWIRDYKAICEPDSDEIIDLYTYSTEFERVAFCAAVCDIEAARHGYKLIRIDTFKNDYYARESDLYLQMANVNHNTPKEEIDDILIRLGMIEKEN